MAPTRVCLGILILALFAVPALAQNDLPDPDLSIMLKLQKDYGWGPVLGWPENTNPCPSSGNPWNGVSCVNDRVEFIMVHCGAQKLNQPIPPELGQLSAARDISVSNCGLYGPIGDVFKNSTRLTELRLDQNNLTGTIPDYIGRLTNLLTLSLSANRFTKQPLFHNICSTILRFQGNFITEIPTDVLNPVAPNGLRWEFFNRDESSNCAATLPDTCFVTKCNPAPVGSNVCTPQRTACSSALSLQKISGDAQRTQVGTAFANQLKVLVTDQNSSPVPNVQVNFTGPGIASTSAQTDISGIASAYVTANSVVGGNTVTAYIGTAMTTFGLTAGTQAACTPTVMVSSSADSGPGTLRSALAEVCPGGVIDLNLISSQTIALSSTASSYNFSGRLYLGTDVTIEGRNVTINGSGKTRIFFIQTGKAVLRNLTLTNGLGQGGNSQYGGPAAGMGGAIFQNGGTLTMSGVSLVNNLAQGGVQDTSGLSIGGGFGANGTGGDLGALSLLGDGAGGIAETVGGPGGFGAGGGPGTTGNYYKAWGGFGGFGAAGGQGFGTNSVGAALIGDTAGYNGGWGASELGGAGFGGAIFSRSGILNLTNVTFTGNQAIGSAGAQGKGGALFLYKGALLNQTALVNYSANVAAAAGAKGSMYSDDTYSPATTCPGVDNVNVCGVLPSATVTASVNGNGTVTDSNGLLNCGSVCSGLYQTPTTLIATPATGYSFSNWTGGCSGSGACVLNPGSSATAVFTANPTPTVTSFKVVIGSQSYELIGSTRIRLPWTTITGIRVTFSTTIQNANASSLTGITATGFSGLGTNTLTWNFATPLPLGAVSTSLLGTGQNAIIGGGVPIATFNRTFKVLPGDYNDDGNVNSLDLVGVNNARSLTYNILADIDANGVVDLNDVTLVRNRVGTSLP